MPELGLGLELEPGPGPLLLPAVGCVDFLPLVAVVVFAVVVVGAVALSAVVLALGST